MWALTLSPSFITLWMGTPFILVVFIIETCNFHQHTENVLSRGNECVILTTVFMHLQNWSVDYVLCAYLFIFLKRNSFYWQWIRRLFHVTTVIPWMFKSVKCKPWRMMPPSPGSYWGGVEKIALVALQYLSDLKTFTPQSLLFFII